MFHQVNLVSALRKTFPALIVITLFVLVQGQSVTSNVDQTASQSPTPETRKTLIYRSPQMPEKSTVAITAIRNLQGDQWLRDLEIEVQNNFSKPIYHLEIDLRFPEVAIDAGAAVIPLMFGKYELMEPGDYAAATDKSIRPGEKYIFKIPEPDRKGMELYLAKSNRSVSEITKVTLRIYELSFGDGTGFEMGEPFFHKKSLNQQMDFRKARPATFIKTRASPEAQGSKEFPYALLTAASTLTASNMIFPQSSCPSPCRQYERVLEKCPYIETGPCAKRIFREATGSTQNPRCIGFFCI
ncbi:MAG: hypothetical protein V7641_2922 [Blastocatellia bacterium]